MVALLVSQQSGVVVERSLWLLYLHVAKVDSCDAVHIAHMDLGTESINENRGEGSSKACGTLVHRVRSSRIDVGQQRSKQWKTFRRGRARVEVMRSDIGKIRQTGIHTK